MLHFLDPFRDFTLASVALRMLLTVLCGGLIGIERAFKRRSAGFRTHILICLGAAMTTMTSLYLVLVMHYYTDLARLGAQVIAGIGFIGAGTIIVTKRHRVKGLTTAAGLWLTAIIGLCCGAGFYEGALTICVLIYIVLVSLNKLDATHVKASRVVNLYVELKCSVPLSTLLRSLKAGGIQVNDIQDLGSHSDETRGYLLELEIMRPELSHAAAAELAAGAEGVDFCEEMKS